MTTVADISGAVKRLPEQNWPASASGSPTTTRPCGIGGWPQTRRRARTGVPRSGKGETFVE